MLKWRFPLLPNGYHTLLIHLEYVFSTLPQRFISQLPLADLSWQETVDPPNGGISAVLNLIERRTFPEDTFLVSLDVTTLYTNIPQEEGKNKVCRAYDILYWENTPVPTQSLRKFL